MFDVGNLPKYSGRRQLFYVDDDSNLLCANCANDNDEFSSPIVACYPLFGEFPINAELHCDRCSACLTTSSDESITTEDRHMTNILPAGTHVTAQQKYGPREITYDDYHEMLCILPPMGWVQNYSGTSFKMSERTCGNLTNIYAHVGDKYYVLCDDMSLPHHEIINRCLVAA